MAARGYCAVTEPDAGDCSRDESGYWRLSSSTASALQDCKAMCLTCARCSMVSFSVLNADCSWYSSCDVERLQPPAAVASDYRTLYVKAPAKVGAPVEKWQRVVDSLNDRFVHGGRLAQPPERMGVFVHINDGTEDTANRAPWLPCIQNCDGAWPITPRDRLAAGLLFKSMPRRPRWGSLIPMPLGGGSRGGIVLRPRAGQVRCGYPHDGRSRSKPDGCFCLRESNSGAALPERRLEPRPECYNASGRPREWLLQHQCTTARSIDQHTPGGVRCHHWCEPQGRTEVTGDQFMGGNGTCRFPPRGPGGGGFLPWRPRDLHGLLLELARMRRAGGWVRANSIEMVISPTRWNATLAERDANWRAAAPSLVEAFFLPVQSAASPSNSSCACVAGRNGGDACGRGLHESSTFLKQRAEMQRTRSRFLAEYNLSGEMAPIVRLHLDCWERPFSL